MTTQDNNGINKRKRITTTGSLCSRLRGSNRTSTLIPDLDNANVGTGKYKTITENTNEVLSVFLLHRKFGSIGKQNQGTGRNN